MLMALLLPLGVWLIQVAATPRPAQARALLTNGIGGGVALASIVACAALVDLRFISAIFSNPESALLLLLYVPFVLLAFLIAHAPIANEGRISISAVLGALTSIGTFFAYRWIRGGWLAQLGAQMQLGHGAVDLAGISLIATLAGAAGAALTVRLKREQLANSIPKLPRASNATLALLGSVCVVVGTNVITSGTQPNVRLIFAALIAALGISAYSYFVARRGNVLWLARSLVAAALIVSAGGVLLPMEVVVLLGVCAAACVVLGAYFIEHKLNLRDDHATLSAALFPAVLGVLAVGVFADGSYGVGFNGVGARQYMRMLELGVVGVLGAYGISDIGQLSAQIVALVVCGGMAFAASALVAAPLLSLNRATVARSGAIQQIEDEADEIDDVPLIVEPILAADTPIIEAPLAPMTATSPQATFATATSVASATSLPSTSADVPVVIETIITEPEPPAQLAPPVAPESAESNPHQSLLERLHLSSRKKELPKSAGPARKVAYPSSVRQRKIIVPLTQDEIDKLKG